MAYELHIERDGGIPVEEWKRAVASVPGLRLDDREVTATNPVTGARITVPGCDGDVAMILDGEWVKVFHYFRGRVRFKAVNTDDAESPVTRAATALAQTLAAEIVGDGGERHRF